MTQSNPFKWKYFQREVILLCVRWYLRYSLSYRDLEEIMAERGLKVDHTTIYRWVQIKGYEIMNAILKGQIKDIRKGGILSQKKFIESLFDIAA